MFVRTILPIAIIVLLAACRDEPIIPPAIPEPTSDGAAAPIVSSAPLPTATTGSLQPETMELSEWRGMDLKGELGCGFAGASAEGPLLFAASFVDPAAISEAAIKLDGEMIKLATQTKGGFDALVQGGRFFGPGGVLVNVVRSGERVVEDPPIAMESPRYPALMVLSRSGQELSIDGFWECGP